MNTDELTDHVKRCIAKKQEGDSWDYKRQWYAPEKKQCLLHDVLCMANLTSDEDGIIIIGVDEENDCNLVDVTNDPNRKDTHEMVKFLRDKPFDGGIRPTVRVEEVIVRGVTLDVIVVENTSYTPFYLTSRFQQVEAYHIYTRVGDSNTPIDRSADRDKVEALWKKRFGIDKPPLERMKIYLRDYKNWVTVDGEQSWYYKFAPEFRMETEFDEGRDGYEYYCCLYPTHKPSWYWLRLKYHATLMAETLLVSLDGGNYQTAIPNHNTFIDSVIFYYFVEDDINYSLHRFFSGLCSGLQKDYYYQRWEELVPVFRSEEEAKDFFSWVKNESFPERETINGFIPEEYKNTKWGEQLKDQYMQAEMLTQKLNEYRNRLTIYL